MTPKKFHQILIFLIPLSIAGLALLSFPLLRGLDNLSKNVAEKEARLINFNEKERTLESLSINYKKIEKDMENILKALPEEKESSSLIVSLEALSSEKSLRANSLVYKTETVKKKKSVSESGEATKEEGVKTGQGLTQTEKDGDLYNFPFEITLEGSYSQVLEALREIENLSRLLIVKKTTITKIKGDEGDTRKDLVTAKFNINAYLKP